MNKITEHTSKIIGGSVKSGDDKSMNSDNSMKGKHNTTTDNSITGGDPMKIGSKDIDNVVDEVFNNVTECSFNGGDKKAVCSPAPVIKKMKDYVEKKGKKTTDSPVQIVNTMKDLLNCKSESCILKRDDFVAFAKSANMEEILDRFFKPEGPSHDFGLLSNFNIDDVLDQFEERFVSRKFLHIPFQMRDFEKVGTRLATVDLALEFKSKYKTFGVVLNTDWSNGRGIHWFCLFGEDHGDKIILEYFNSSGRAPLPEVQAWLQKTKHHLAKTLKKPIEIYYSTGISYQNDDHSCGVYCLCYIWLRLENVPPQWFKKATFNDKLMHLARKNLFRHEQ